MLNKNPVDVKVINILNLYDRLIIPEFQRKYVWNETNRRELIESISDGYPIGALTLFNNESNTNKGNMQLIDGLQRVMTILGFLTKPSDLFSWQRFQSSFEAQTDKIISEMDTTKSIKQKILKNTKTFYSDNFSHTSTLSKFVKETCFLTIYDDLGVAEEVFESLIFSLERVNMEVPVIIYSGPEDTIPEIFDRMNRGSVRLSKYEHYAATWHKYKLESSLEVTWLDNFYGLHYSNENLLNMVGEKPEDRTIEGPFELLLSYSNFLSNNKKINKVGLRLSKNIDNNTILISDVSKIENYSYRDVKDENFLVKQYSKDEIGFELISLVFGYSPTQIQKVVVNNLLRDGVVSSGMISLLNSIIVEIDKIIWEVGDLEVFNTNDANNYNYLSYFVLVGYFKLKFEVDLSNCELRNRKIEDIYKLEIISHLLDVDQMNLKEWFRGDKRQVSFLTRKLGQFDSLIDKTISFTEFWSD